jgi:hypothetical protein
MSITAAHEGVVAHPTVRRQLWVVDPDVARSNPEWAVAAIRARLSTHRRTRFLLSAGGFAFGAVLGGAAAWLGTYNALGFAVLALVGGALIAGLVVPRVFPASPAVDAVFAHEHIVPLLPLKIHGVVVDDTMRWETLWILARDFSALNQAENDLDALLERSDISPDEATRRRKSIQSLRTRAVEHASAVWVSVAKPFGYSENVSDGS